MNADQKAVLEEVPVSYRKIFERGFTTNRKTLGIKAFCLHCVGYVRADVAACTARGCPLWEHRPYKSEGADEETEAE